MGHPVAIDLGTAYSIVAVGEEFPNTEGFFTTPECPGCSIILDDYKRPLTPSVVAEDGQGEILVGHGAKSRAGRKPDPVMFSKRWMGEDKEFQLAKHGVIRPVDAAAHILKHLKALAERRLNASVDEAVITVPAHFAMKAREMTGEAAQRAGLRVIDILQEPVAAALMYFARDHRDPLRIMTYDLGGGTFDIAIVEKRDGVISSDSIRAFHGDRFLGGYNFDEMIANWLVEQLIGNNYDLKLNLEDPEDQITYAKLMVYAERAKIKLSDLEVHEIEEPNTGIVDHQGHEVEIRTTITRVDFENMIGAEIDRTIELCHVARTEKTKDGKEIPMGEIDEIILVGGSSKIPLIRRRLEETFHIKPKLVMPDLCVALGAALLVKEKQGQTARGALGGKLHLDRIPESTSMPTLQVTGWVEPAGESAEGCHIRLRAADDSFNEARTSGPGGVFVFDDVPLAIEASTDFTVAANSPRGGEIARHRFSVRHSEAANAGHISMEGNILSKSIGILVIDDEQVIFEPVAHALTPLPYAGVLSVKTRDTSGTIRIEIQEENNPLGQITMQQVPATLPIGSEIEITLNISEQFELHAEAYVPSLGLKDELDVQIPTRPIPTKEQLRARFEKLLLQKADVLANATPGERMSKGKQLEARMAQCQEMLQASRPDASRIQDALDEVEMMIAGLRSKWNPKPRREVFDGLWASTDEDINVLENERPESAKDGYRGKLAAIRTEADKAYTAKKQPEWAASFGQLEDLNEQIHQALRKIKSPPSSSSPPPDPAALLLQCSQELVKLEKQAHELDRFKPLRAEFEAVAAALKSIQPKAADAMIQLSDWHQTKFMPLARKVSEKGTGTDGIPGL